MTIRALKIVVVMVDDGSGRAACFQNALRLIIDAAVETYPMSIASTS